MLTKYTLCFQTISPRVVYAMKTLCLYYVAFPLLIWCFHFGVKSCGWKGVDPLFFQAQTPLNHLSTGIYFVVHGAFRSDSMMGLCASELQKT